MAYTKEALGDMQKSATKMKVICNILIFASLFIITNGQFLDSKRIELNYADRQYELFQDKPGSEQFLLIKKFNGETIETLKLPEEFDPFGFAGVYEGERSFILIGGRYKFYIFNTITENIIGPISASPRGEIGDAQSGVWYAFKILNDGQYILANALDFGLYCYDIQDLYNPNEIDYVKSDSTFLSGNYTFIDLRKDDIYNVITASCGNYNKEISSELMLIGYKFQQDSARNLDYKIIDNRYLSVKHIKPDLSLENLLIDLETGTLK